MIYAWDEANTREAAKGRSGGICEFCSSARATDMHHRISRGVGGKWSPANILHICRACHSDANRPEAYESGLSLRRHEDPEAVRVHRKTGETVFLSDDVTPPLKRKK